MSMIWVELLNAHHEVVERHRLGAAPLRIGRAYDNDIVLADPHVAPTHLQVSLDEQGRPQVEDLGSVNGLWVRQRRWQRVARWTPQGDELLRLGRTLLRVRARDYAVAPERPLPSSRWALVGPPLALMAALIGLELLDAEMQRTTQAKPLDYLGTALILPLILAGATLIWATIGRIFVGVTRVREYFMILGSALLAWSVFAMLWPMVAFAYSWNRAWLWNLPLGWAATGVTVLMLLQAISPRYLAVKATVVTALVGTAIVLGQINRHQAREFVGPSVVLGDLEPQYLRVVQPLPLDDFLQRTAPFEQELTEARKEPPPSRGGGLLDF